MISTWTEGNVIATRKPESQLTEPEILVAAGLGPWEKNSATMNHGMEPGMKHK